MVARLTGMKRYGTTIASAAMLSCSGEIGQMEPGLLSLKLRPSAAVRLMELEYTVSHEKGFVRSGPVAIGDTPSFSFKVDTLPPALGYEVTAVARGVLVSTNASTVCTGYASFEVKAAQATSVSMTLQCDGAARAGSSTQPVTEQDDSPNKSANKKTTTPSANCPAASALAASPAEAPVGHELLLSASVADEKDGPLPLAFRWSADSGVLASPSAKQTRFLCNSPGVVPVYFSISNGDQGCDADPVSLEVTCTGGNCIDLTHCPNSQAGIAGANAASSGVGGVAARAGQGGSAISNSHGTAGGSVSAGGRGAVMDNKTTTIRGGSGGSAQVDPWPTLPIDTQNGTQRRNRNAGGRGGEAAERHTTNIPQGGSGSSTAGSGSSTSNGGAGNTSIGGAGGVGMAGMGGTAMGQGGASNEGGHPPAAGSGEAGATGAAGAGGAAGSGGAPQHDAEEEPQQ